MASFMRYYPGDKMHLLLKLLLLLISGASCAFYGAASENDTESAVVDPSIWSIRTCVDDLIDGWFVHDIEPSSEQVMIPPRVFTTDDYELKNLLLASIYVGDWDLYDELSKVDLKEWESVPEVEEVLTAIAGGPSEIIFDLFFKDERIRSDPRIRTAGSIFINHNAGLHRIARFLDSGVFVCKDLSWAEVIYAIKAPLPPEFYSQSLPDKSVKYSSLDATNLMTLVAINRSVPETVLKFLINDTDISLAPVPFGGRTISLPALAEKYNNTRFWHILIKCPRYEAEIAKNFGKRLAQIC